MKTIWNLYVKYFDIINFPICIMTLFIFKRLQVYNDKLSFVDIVACILWTIYFCWICPPKAKYYEYLALPAFAYTISFYVIHWDRMSEMFQAIWHFLF